MGRTVRLGRRVFWKMAVAAAAVAWSVPEAGAQITTSDSNVGFIDSAVIGTRARIRFDAVHDGELPDRAEFFYAKCGCFNNPDLGRLFDPDADGPLGREDQPGGTSFDYQELMVYLELAPLPWLSGFVEFGMRIIDPPWNDNTAGFADMNAGFRMALRQNECSAITFQFRTYIPTGDSSRGLGTNHVSFEPALLMFRRLSDRVSMEAELRDWIAVDATDFSGNVLRYGTGLNWEFYRSCPTTITSVFELVGWTLFDGRALTPDGDVISVNGDTIINFKIGLRLRAHRHQLYMGYGLALTGDAWYDDILRVEHQIVF